MIAPLVILTTFLGCCSSVIFLELLINEGKNTCWKNCTTVRDTIIFLYFFTPDAGCGNLVTFSHFLFISLEGFIFTTKFGQKSPKVPIKEWLNLVIIYFIVNVMNNWTFSFNISMPLYMIFKSVSYSFYCSFCHSKSLSFTHFRDPLSLHWLLKKLSWRGSIQCPNTCLYSW